METRIVSHHVGGRGFGVSLNTPPGFWGDLVHVLYEADADNARQMVEDLSHPQRQQLGSHLFIAPFCLGEHVGQQTLNLTANAFASSLFEPNPKFFEYYCEVEVAPSYRDVTYHNMLDVVERVPVDVFPLDYLFEQGKVPFSEPPDFLSIDTQGYELAIIKGGRKIIERHVLAIVSEVEIKSMYSGQPLLGDLLTHLDAAGFHFAGFPYLQEVSTYRGPIGFRGNGFPAFGDALFLRRIDDVKRMAESPIELFSMLRKLAFIAINFGHIEYGLQALMEAQRVGVTADERNVYAKRNYSCFLDEVLKAYSEAERLYPGFYVTPEASKPSTLRRREKSSDGKSAGSAAKTSEPINSVKSKISHKERLIASGRRWWRAFQIKVLQRAQMSQRRIRYLVWHDPLTAIAKVIVYARRRFVKEAGWTSMVLMSPPSRFESLLQSYGLVKVAEIVRARRMTTESCVRKEGHVFTNGADFSPEALAIFKE